MRLILARLLTSFDFQAVNRRELQWEGLRTFLLVEKLPLEVRVRLAPDQQSLLVTVLFSHHVGTWSIQFPDHAQKQLA